MIASSQTLPPLRQELRLESAPRSVDGLSRWHLFDPLSNRYFLLADTDTRLLPFFGKVSTDQLVTALSNDGHHQPRQQVEELLSFLEHNQLLVDSRLDSPAHKRTIFGGVRFFPLWDPRSFLLHIGHTSRPAFRVAIALWALLTLDGLITISQRWDEFLATFNYFLNVWGLLVYLLVLALLKLLHELGHARAAMDAGIQPGRIGIALVWGIPLLYTELTHMPRVLGRRHRMRIASAGVTVELLVAGIALQVWAHLPDGMIRSTAFVIATSTLTTTLLINLNPLARFDGYYWLADRLRIDNLMTRSLALFKVSLLQLLLGSTREPWPELLPRGRRLSMTLYGALCWAYQLLLLLGIATLFYYFVHWLAGALLLALFTGRMLLQPLASALYRVWSERMHLSSRRLGGLTLTLLLITSVLLVPLDQHVTAPAIIHHPLQERIKAPEDSRVVAIHIQNGERVRAGQLLIELESPELEHQYREAMLQRQLLNQRLQRISATEQDRTETQVLEEELQQVNVRLDGILKRADRLQVRASADGRVENIPVSLRPGDWLAAETNLLGLKDDSQLEILAYVQEEDWHRLQPGDHAHFRADDPNLPALDGSLRELAPAALETLGNPQLSIRHGGEIATSTNADGDEVPLQAYHLARLTLDQRGPDLHNTMQGMVQIKAEPHPLISSVIEHLWKTLLTQLETAP